MQSRHYHLVDPATYGGLIEKAGFGEVQLQDSTSRFNELLLIELSQLADKRKAFVKVFPVPLSASPSVMHLLQEFGENTFGLVKLGLLSTSSARPE